MRVRQRRNLRIKTMNDRMQRDRLIHIRIHPRSCSTTLASKSNKQMSCGRSVPNDGPKRFINILFSPIATLKCPATPALSPARNSARAAQQISSFMASTDVDIAALQYSEPSGPAWYLTTQLQDGWPLYDLHAFFICVHLRQSAGSAFLLIAEG
jgi:hypothetical protein